MNRYAVSKVMISVVDGPETRYLLSIKQKPGSFDHGRLEFLGGRLEPGENPESALLRELKEEELTGSLSGLAARKMSAGPELITGDARHFMFSLELSVAEYQQLAHDPAESQGFRLVPRAELVPGESFTWKTNLILTALAG